jgi:phosphate transport system protein
MEVKADKDISKIRETIVGMIETVEKSVSNSINSFLKLDSEQAGAVIANDKEINLLEIKIDKDVFEHLALNAPVATDLRLLFCILKINKDLERIGDHAVNIAQSTFNCLRFTWALDRTNLELMCNHTMTMLHDAFRCFEQSDPQLALHVLEQDDNIDNMNRLMSNQIIEIIKTDSTSIETALELLRVSKNLERIADLSTNIAESVIFHLKALDVKHHHLISEQL